MVDPAPTDADKQLYRDPPLLNIDTVKKVRAILEERRNPKNPPSQVQTGRIFNPNNLKPIHLRSAPLPALSPEDALFAVNYGAGNIVQRRNQEMSNHVAHFKSQERPRKKCLFVDDSAIEIDEQGEDIQSTPTTPNNSPPPSPPRSPAPSLPTNLGTPIKKYKVKKPKLDSFCELCVTVTSGPAQLAIHYKSKKHLKKSRRKLLPNKDLHCSTCDTKFDNIHNFGRHKCHKFMK